MASDHPFTPVCPRPAFLATPACGEILRRLDEGLGDREPFLVVTGDPGTGKTTLAGEVVARWGELVSVAFLAYSTFTEAELLEEIVRRLGGDPPEGGSRSRLLAAFERALAAVAERGQIALLVVDDAHALPAPHLESLRLLANAARQARQPLEILLLGLPALEARLDEAGLAALRQRIAVRVRLEPLAPPETRRYLQHRVTAAGGDGAATFPKKTCREIAARTGGVPRRINALAAEALRVAHAWGDAAVGVEHVQTAAAALGGFIPVSLPDEADPGDDVPQVRVLPAKPGDAAKSASPPSSVKPAEAKPASAANPAAAVKPVQAEAAAQAKRAAPPAPVPAPPAAAAAKAARPAPAANAAPAPRPMPPAEEEEPVVITPSTAKQDPEEWVARFVGDKGPLQIGSRSRAESGWIDPVLVEEAAAADEAAEGAGAKKGAGAAGGRSPRRRAAPAVATAVLALLVVAAAVVLLLRSGVLARVQAARAPEAARGGAKSSAYEPLEDRAPEPAARKTRRESEPATAVGAADPAPPAAEAPEAAGGPRRPVTIDVATRRADLGSAMDERDRLSALTGIRGWVVPDANGGYRIVLGIFKSPERAASAAAMLVRSRTLASATVVPLPPPRLRQ